jgi:uncharacterized membrane protein
MWPRHAPVIVFAVLCFTLAGLVAYYLSMLPDRLATHFDAGGRANGWSNQAGFIRTVVILIAIAAAIFLASGQLSHVPEWLINLPNKSYWLAPARRDDTFTFMRDWLRWFVVVTLALVTLIIGMALRANLAAPPELPGYSSWALVAYAAIVVAMGVVLLRRFRAQAG